MAVYFLFSFPLCYISKTSTKQETMDTNGATMVMVMEEIQLLHSGDPSNNNNQQHSKRFHRLAQHYLSIPVLFCLAMGLPFTVPVQ